MHGRLLIALVAVGITTGLAFSAYAQTKDGKDRRVVIVNERSSDLVRLYGSRTTIGDWEENILVKSIKAGSKQLINFDDGTGACLFDFRAVFKDNLQAHMWSFNVCRESYWVLVD